MRIFKMKIIKMKTAIRNKCNIIKTIKILKILKITKIRNRKMLM